MSGCGLRSRYLHSAALGGINRLLLLHEAEKRLRKAEKRLREERAFMAELRKITAPDAPSTETEGE